MGRDSAPSQAEDEVFTWPPEKPVGLLDFLSSRGMIIRVRKDNWRVEFEGGLGTLGDSEPAAVKEPSRGYGNSAFSRRFWDQASCWTPVSILCTAAIALAREESPSNLGFVTYSHARVCSLSLSVCISLNAAEVDEPNYGLSFKINMKPLGWFMQPGSQAIETSKTSMRQHWRLKPWNQRAFIVKRHGKQGSKCCLHPQTWDKTQQRATKPTSVQLRPGAELNRGACQSQCPYHCCYSHLPLCSAK